MAYTKVFDNPYPNGWVDAPSIATPLTAAALQEHTDAIEHIEDYLASGGGGGGTGSSVSWNQIKTSGEKIATITIDGTPTDVYAATQGGGGGSDVAWNQKITSGTNIATVTINGVSTEVYAPTSGGGSGAAWGQITGTLSDQTDLQTALNSKVDKVSGKGLSSNDYTTSDKNKLAGIEAGANNYSLPVATTSTLGGVKADGTTTTIDADGTIHASGSGGDFVSNVGIEQTTAGNENRRSLAVTKGNVTNYTTIPGTLYYESSVVLSASAPSSVTFYQTYNIESGAIDVYASIFGINPTGIETTTNSCTVTFPASTDHAGETMNVRLYVK